MVRVIAEFVDVRNGKRYGIGQGGEIDPPLTAKQIERLTRAECIEDGEEEKRVVKTSKALDYRKLSADQLTAHATDRKIPLGDAKLKKEIIVVLERADKGLPNYSEMSDDELHVVAAEKGVSVEADASRGDLIAAIELTEEVGK